MLWIGVETVETRQAASDRRPRAEFKPPLYESSLHNSVGRPPRKWGAAERTCASPLATRRSLFSSALAIARAAGTRRPALTLPAFANADGYDAATRPGGLPAVSATGACPASMKMHGKKILLLEFGTSAVSDGREACCHARKVYRQFLRRT